ncbi:hypothetical protein ASG39_14605 [Rhizobium sp. Leaf371]|nr:hypothetical protein ASG39_14605 [Rhizobium sp. Leaf371]
MDGSDFRAAVPVGERDALRTAAGHAFDDDATFGDADDLGIAQAGIAGSGAGFTLAAAIATTLPTGLANDRTNAVRADTQLDTLGVGNARKPCGSARCNRQRHAGRNDNFHHDTTSHAPFRALNNLLQSNWQNLVPAL